MSTQRTLIPIYTTRGDVGGFLVYPYVFNPMGEWIGWVTPTREVYSVHGIYAGYLTGDPRILRNRGDSGDHPRMLPPLKPAKILPPAMVPLPPMMAETRFDTLDVFDEDPDLLPTFDFGEQRLDLD